MGHYSSPLPVTLQCPGEPEVVVGHITLSPKASAPPTAGADNVATTAEETCSFEVDQWGPQQGIAGQGFNLQDDGSSAVWVSTKSLRGHPIVRVGTMIGDSLQGTSLITVSFRNPDLFTHKAELQVSVQCHGQPEVTLGKISLTAG